MTEPKYIEARVVLFADLPHDAKNDTALFERAIKAAIEYYTKIYGVPKRLWVNPKDAPESVEIVDNFRVERRTGCVRGKVMVL